MQNYFTPHFLEKYWTRQIHRLAILLPLAFFQLVLLIGTAGTNTLQAQCSITLKPTVSGCYLSSGSSKATISVEVAWANPPSGGQITVTGPAGSVPATRTIQIGNIATSYEGTDGTVFNTTVFIGSPQVVAFEVPADGSTGKTVTARFNSTCTATSAPFNIPAACQTTACPAGQLGGTVFFDYNANGVREKGEAGGISDNEGLSGVTVKIFDCNGALVGTTTTNSFGKYSFNVPAKAYPVRVEFSNLASYAGQGTLSGTDNRTTVQFIKAPDCNVDLGILNPSDYCQNFPRIVTSCFVNGNPLTSGSATASGDALVSFKYGKTGPKDATAVTVLADAAKIGSVWGIAYDKYKERLFTSAVLRRHSGLGPAGLGGIYVTNMITNTTSTYVDLEAAPLSINLGTIPSNSSRGLPTTLSGPSNDQAAFALVGKAGIGDLEISEDGQFLYFTNLHDKKLYKLNISGATPTLAGSYAIPTVCSGGSNRPFGLKVYQGKVYVGTVCDGQTSTTTSNLRAIIQSFDPATTTFTEIFNFPLTYPKGPVFLSEASANAPLLKLGIWNNWSDDFNDLNTGSFSTNTDSYRIIYPQPILSDIEFDIDGSMILGLADRTGLQTGFKNYAPTGTTNLYSAFSGGDILRAAKSGSTFILENNGKVDGITGSDPSNNQGPGFGEFYNDDWLSFSGKLNHSEQAFGALALRPGSGKVILTAMDPLNRDAGGTVNAGGVKYLNNDTGKPDSDATAGFLLYVTDQDAGTFAKSTGLGDLELTCDLPNYLEIGNYVWNDANKNGVQEACEKPLAGINVTLYKGTSKLATTKTTTNGEYYFSSKSRLGSGWTGTGADTTLLENTAYRIVFGEGQLTGSLLNVAGLGQFEATTKNSTANNGNTQNDSDVAFASGAFSISFSTTTSGKVNHTYDAGFVCVIPSIGNKITVTPPTCSGVTSQNNGKVSLSAAIAPFTKFRVKTGTGAWTGDTTFATATAIGSTFPFDLQTSVPNAGATYKIRFYIGECCYKDTTITVNPVSCLCTKPNAGINQTICAPITTAALTGFTPTGGTWSAQTGNPSAATVSSTGAVTGMTAAGVYNFIYTVQGGCSDTVSVTRNAKPNAGADKSICQPLTATSLTGFSPAGGSWTVDAKPTGTTPTVTSTGAVTGMTATGTYSFIYTVSNCTDTVQVTVNAKPNAGGDKNLACADPVAGTLQTSTSLAGFSPAGGTWSAVANNPATATVTNAGAVSGMVNAGTYRFIYTVGSCADTVAITVQPCTGCVKPNAGPDVTLTCSPSGITATTATLNAVTSGGTWAPIGSPANPAAATINPTTGAVAGMTAAGTYRFVYSITGGGIVCTDTAAVIVPTCVVPLGSIGDYVWKDANKDGKQDAGEAGVNGIKVILWNATSAGTPTGKRDSTTTAGGGKYLFSNLPKGDYLVQFVKSTLPADCNAFTAKDSTAAGTTDKNDSDADKTTGITGKVSLDPKVLSGTSSPADSLATNNLTVDAGLLPATICIKPNAGPDQTLVCGTTAPSTANLVDALAGQKWKVLSVQPNTTVSVTTPAGLVSGMTAPGQYRFILQTQSDSLACRDTVSIMVPNCACPTVNVLTHNAIVCKDSLFPNLSVTIIGNNTQGVTATWYANATGGSVLSTGLNFKPTGLASVTDTFYVQLNGVTTNCQQNPRTPVVVTVQDCTKEVDLALKKLINTKVAQIGDVLTYTLKVYNQSNTGATGVEVTDSIATTVQFQTGSFIASRGSAAISGNVIKWTIGNIAANGDTVTLTYKVKATQEGVHFNTAEISKTNEKDVDSTPGNGNEGEDDIDRQCFTVPVKLCPGEKAEVNIPTKYTNVQWFKNGGSTSIGSGNFLLISEVGTYTFTATNQSCPASGCCPIIIEPGVNCCPEDLCIPFTVKQTKKGKK
ncbi:SdrD B-like domain-containing protein [Runella slithyformis]|uniref:Conserved repeat domain protein n=1 Tax=Runella slithyformis (strain ATCC 29530 / DSM 19594 / LMG 11500 / NCIMB 11436 / LSU 4) TaxID=761193 RepID=A0A7U4E723_RUNSL|nr:SdrD B-like domain-containing protein [Runella slithyformis]AEI49739.1 conserved repeat domain protein [Runella slithyformis DSM 19594]